jgi:hypothetical protein
VTERARLALMLPAAALTPSVALANAGTPLMWAGILHLLIGNLVVGVAEGLILARLFHRPKLRCVWLMILANYFSAWFGGLLLRGAIVSSLPLTIHNAKAMWWLMALVTFFITLLMEFPLVALAMRGAPDWTRKAVRGSLIVQSASYVVLLGWYGLASGTSLVNDTDIAALSEMSLPDRIVVYYIADDDGDVYTRPLGEERSTKVYDLNASHHNDRLLVLPSVDEDGTWRLLARLDSESRRGGILVTVYDSVRARAAPQQSDMREMSEENPRYHGSWFNFGNVPKLAAAKDSPWEFRTGFWPVEGLRGNREDTRESVSLAFETLFGQWNVRNATHLPTDKVLLQLGTDQICLFDPVKRQLALVARGRGPVAVIAGAVEGAPPPPPPQ